MAIGIVAAVVPRDALSQSTSVCRPGGGDCIRTTSAVYNRCVDLAFRRGLTSTKGDRGPFDAFLYSCVRGRVR
jgi:hypothetical protein